MTAEDRKVVEYQQHRHIDGEEYKIFVLTPTRSIKLLTKITKILGEPFAEMAGGIKAAQNKEQAQEKAAALLPKAVRALVQRLDEDQVLDVVKQIIGAMEYNGKPINFEKHFQGRLGHMVKVIYAGIEVNYEDFFSALVEMMSGD